MSDYTPSLERVRDLYSWAYAWRTNDYPPDGEADLSQLRDKQRAEFDRMLAAHDREVAARAVEAVAHDLAEPRTLWWSNAYGPQVQTDDETGAKVTLDDWFAERAAAYRADQDGEQS